MLYNALYDGCVLRVHVVFTRFYHVRYSITKPKKISIPKEAAGKFMVFSVEADVPRQRLANGDLRTVSLARSLYDSRCEGQQSLKR